MLPLRLSVVIVSWARPRALARCLTALSQMRSTRFELIVVADDDGLNVARRLSFSDRITFIRQDFANISAARNQGIVAAAGDVVAFIDDDAVPEPDWAEATLTAFEDPGLSAATGPVIGRNGLSLQWGLMATDRTGRDRWLAKDDTPGADETVKLHGTNMAIRRSCVTLLGGFDPVFGFYLDETDLARRLAYAGKVARYIPELRVHHGYAESPRRRADRVPTDLTDIGASTAIFLRKHAPDQIDTALTALVEDQRLRLLRLARGRKIGAAEMRRLSDSLRSGIETGLDRDFSPLQTLPDPSRGFVPLRDTLPPPLSIRDGWWHQAARLRAEAQNAVAMGHPVALIMLEPTPRKHKIAFTDGGWWEQTGGLFGPADRSEPRFQIWRRAGRAARERARLFQASP
ncbi:glycosyltransferase family 2 protein [Roseicyclus marinus]|uniref:glycosyltransferase family 2 protein n=1 Tax=Roseicyclus marinus TaxID=2161673 RepID=UPI00240EB453|nr:glycosyltransferase [Roseicyclus marinus]MDG3041469.1 glycosyltransferase [Roseicyclus marinus]